MIPTVDSIAAALVKEGAPAATANIAAGIFMSRVKYSENGGMPEVINEYGQPAVNADGTPMYADALMRSLRHTLPDIFGEVSTPARSATPASPESTTARVAREHREATARRERQAVGDANPWAAGSVNITQQVLIAHRDPTRAAQLKAEAGVK